MVLATIVHHREHHLVIEQYYENVYIVKVRYPVIKLTTNAHSYSIFTLIEFISIDKYIELTANADTN